MARATEIAIMFGTCAVLLAGVEVVARALRLWVYKSRGHHVAFAICAVVSSGMVAVAVAARPLGLRFAAGAVLGVVVEAANLHRLRFWSFPGDRLLVLRGRVAIILAAGIPWGVMPAVAPWVVERLR